MEALKANPESIEVIFQKHYIIPDYQRPYSWEEGECEQLWSDIYDAYQEYKNNKNNQSYYFLGNIVIYQDETLGDQHLNVVDGQQRLTSLLLLIRALFEKNRSFKKLQNLLFASSPKDLADIDYTKQKITTLVIDKDNESFANIISLDETPDKSQNKNKYINNFYVFANKIEEYLKDADAYEFEDFITYTITKVKLLSIHCNNFDSAIKIFSTLNNRGLPLTDNDIFKATLYQRAPDTNEFLTNWQELIEFENKELNSTSMFNNYMSYIRAENNTTTSLISLRSFFTKDHSAYLDYEKTINYLNKFKQAHEFLQKSDGKNRNLIECLKNYTNNKPFEPIYIFLIKHLEIDNNATLLSSFNQDKFSLLLKQMVRYSYIKGLVYNSITSIKNDIFKINKDVFHNNDYINTIKNSIKAEEIEQSINEVKKSNLRKYNSGIVILNSTLHHNQQISLDANDVIEIEHILPKKSYNNQDGFTKDEYSENINRLGNLVTLEKRLNIKAKNLPFNDKKIFYIKSISEECKSLLYIDNWNKEAIDNREEKIIETLSKFFND